MTKDITQDIREDLLAKHHLTRAELMAFLETENIQYAISASAARFTGAPLHERNWLGNQPSESQRLAQAFKAKHREHWGTVRSRLLDRVNDYADEYYNRRALGSPNGRHFW